MRGLSLALVGEAPFFEVGLIQNPPTHIVEQGETLLLSI